MIQNYTCLSKSPYTQNKKSGTQNLQIWVPINHYLPRKVSALQNMILSPGQSSLVSLNAEGDNLPKGTNDSLCTLKIIKKSRNSLHPVTHGC